ncbi:VanZ family protein [Paenibacillus sp. GCM10027628]|uniref:VanZ family protein n=1 Tax=Paenibacillus sp. GCM10027628 TaxID=3273413 RepID=UPI00362A746C
MKINLKQFLLYVLPIILWFGLIFALSSQSYQEQDIKPILKKELSDKTITNHFAGTSFSYGSHLISIKADGAFGFIEFFIRKSAHLLVYSVLGMLIARLFKSLTHWRLSRSYFCSVLICAVYAATDEFHQSFVPGRTALVTDVVLDTCGAALGILLYLSISQIFQTIYKKKIIIP